MIVDHAKDTIVDELQTDSDITDYKYIAVGTGGATGTTISDTALTTETDRITGTPGEGTNSDQYQVTGTWTNSTGGSVAVSEIGLFDAASGGNMFCRLCTNDAEISSKTIADGDQLNVTITVTVNDDSE